MRFPAYTSGKGDCMTIMVMRDAGRALRAAGGAGLQLTAALL